MTLDEIIATRYSCRSYDKDRPVSREDILSIVESARLAPSACNSQTWRFVAVTDREKIDAIHSEGMRVGVGNSFLREATALVVGCSKLDFIANTIGRTISGIDYYQVDIGIAMEHMALKATELGLASCWIGWFNEKSLRRLLDIPKSVKITALLSLGYPAAQVSAEKKRKPIGEILMWDKWSI
jgi:nitroreductase